MVNTTPPRTSKTVEYYAREDILPKIKFYGATYKRVDVVFDVYRKSTVKGEARMSPSLLCNVIYRMQNISDTFSDMG